MSEAEKNITENKPVVAGKRVTVVGMGRAGVRAADMLAGIMPGSAEIFLCDTDKNTLEHASLPETSRYLLDSEWRSGAGTGGNFTNAQRSMARERPRLEEMVKGSSCLVVMAGLGGGTGTAGAVAMAGIARRLQIPAFFIVTLPFSLEGSAKQRLAENNWRDLVEIADAVAALPNDLLFSVIDADAPIVEAFVRADEELARVAMGIIDILKGDSLLSSDFAVLTEILRNRKSYCGIGVGRAARTGELNPGLLAVEKMINSPYLGGPGKIKEADAVLFSVTGDADITCGEARTVLEAAKNFADPEAKLTVSAAAEPGFGDYIQVTALTVKYLTPAPAAPVPEPVYEAANGELFAIPQSAAKQPRGRKHSKNGPIQPSLPLEPVSRGIFIKTAQSIYNGADLDIPTWQRRDVHIDKGE